LILDRRVENKIPLNRGIEERGLGGKESFIFYGVCDDVCDDAF